MKLSSNDAYYMLTNIKCHFVGVGLNFMSKYIFVCDNKKEFRVSFDINFKNEGPHTFLHSWEVFDSYY